MPVLALNSDRNGCAQLGSEDYKLVTRYAKQVTVELRAMQLINTIDTLNEKLKTTAATAASKASQ